jgi:ribose transport system permease protein
MSKPLSSWQKFLEHYHIPPIYLILILTFVIAWAFVSLFGTGSFTNPVTLTNILVRSVALGIVAVGQTFAIVAGSLDLSVAYLISVTAVMSSFIMQSDPSRVPMALLVVFSIGIGVGLLNGFLITRLKISPFIATLGSGLLMKGLLDTGFQNFAGGVPKDFQTLAYGGIGPIPYSVILFIGIAAIGQFLLSRTPFGAHVYAVGGNQEVARLAGIRTNRTLLGVHVFTSLTAVLSGLFIVSRLGAGAPWVGPDGVYDLESVAAVVVGGTALSGGRGGVTGTVAGVLIFGILDTMFNLLGIGAFLKQVLRGFIIIIAVASYSIRSKQDIA